MGNTTLYDHATGLPNKPLLLDRINMNIALSKRYKTTSAICHVQINTHTNHQTIAQRLKNTIRAIDTIGKISETEYILVLTDTTEHQCQTILNRITTTLTDTTIDGEKIAIHFHIGVCMLPYSAETTTELLANSKLALQNAQKKGPNTYSFYGEELDEEVQRTLIIENDLPYAIRNNQLKVHYQSQWHIALQKITGVEALIRWEHPKLGLLQPNAFLPIAERNGNLNGIFEWILEKGCQEIVSLGNRDLKLAVNLSIDQLLMDSSEDIIHKALLKSSLPPSKLTLELTEDIPIPIYAIHDVKEKLIRIREKGISIALDDFGNGYFSFSDLVTLPIDFLKLDKKFVHSLVANNKLQPVIAPIIKMAHNLGLKVIVEGVESQQQLEEWQQLGADIIQGFLISKPVPMERLE